MEKAEALEGLGAEDHEDLARGEAGHEETSGWGRNERCD
jgi:hypothetical protein